MQLAYLVAKLCLTLLQPHGLQPIRLLCPGSCHQASGDSSEVMQKMSDKKPCLNKGMKGNCLQSVDKYQWDEIIISVGYMFSLNIQVLKKYFYRILIRTIVVGGRRKMSRESGSSPPELPDRCLFSQLPIGVQACTCTYICACLFFFFLCVCYSESVCMCVTLCFPICLCSFLHLCMDVCLQSSK